MAVKISRDLQEINDEVKKLDKNIKSLNSQNKSLDKSLKLDPKNVTILAQKTENLKKQTELAANKVTALKNAQVKMAEAVKSGAVPAEEYEKLKVKIAQAEIEAKSLNKQLKATNTIDFDKAAANLNKLSNLAIKAVAGIVGFGVAYAKTGDEIQKAAERYRISAEEFQKGSFIFDRATGDGNAYKSTLEAVTSAMAQLARGSGKAVANFAQLGFTFDDFKGKSPAEVVQQLIEKLNGIEDADERATAATVLLGTQGVYLSQVAGLAAEDVASLNEELEANGILTQEEADNAAALNDKIDNFTLSLKKTIAELGVGLLPLLESLISIGQTLIPIIAGIVGWIANLSPWAQKMIAFALLAIIVLPKIILFIKAMAVGIAAIKTALIGTKVAMIATNAAAWLLGSNPIALKILLIAAAVAALILLLVKLANWLSSVFGKKYKLDVDTSSAGIDIADMGKSMGDEAYAAAGSAASNTANTIYNNTNYYDYSTQNNEINNQVDIDEVTEQLQTKIKVGGAR